ncbi:hypothetical protein KCP69_09290 [Salmonella enterica subsp. enterica]|nr:hypothetical protein KCP69_09290 [Salmonella enterica subsp. enterica]
MAQARIGNRLLKLHQPRHALRSTSGKKKRFTTASPVSGNGITYAPVRPGGSSGWFINHCRQRQPHQVGR